MFLLKYFPMLLLVASLQAAEPVRLVTVMDAKAAGMPTYNKLLAEIFKRAHIPYTLEYRPYKRAQIEFQLGGFDGDIGRTAQFNKNYPEAVRVDPTYMMLSYYAFSPNLEVKGWNDLHQLSISYLRGAAIVENQLSNKAVLYPVNETDACIKMVQAQRADSCVLNMLWLNQTQINQLKTRFKVSPFNATPIHIWLAPNQQALASKLGKAIEQMQHDGSLRIYQDALLIPRQPELAH
ncbi:substrate-binding periplasmic protein [Chitinibacter sp. S2-10]|uniref:substrate-binding periplasmic protein n=1 Tax=Chitinibacter sp. S2-10 TaxID=3373597 RepID=UPI0039774E6F